MPGAGVAAGTQIAAGSLLSMGAGGTPPYVPGGLYLLEDGVSFYLLDQGTTDRYLKE